MKLLMFRVMMVMLVAAQASALEITTVSINGGAGVGYSSAYSSREPIYIINGAGFNWHDVPNTHDYATVDGTMWLSGASTLPQDQWIIFNLGDDFTLSNIKVWNYNNNSGFGVGQMEVLVSANGITWTSLGTVSVPAAPVSDMTSFGSLLGKSTATPVRYVKFRVLSNGAGATNSVAWVGLSEVRFYGTSLNNQPPMVEAGIKQSAKVGLPAVFHGTVIDDGLPNPPAAVTLTWSKVSGPGTVSFVNANVADASATFSAAGDYVLQLTASDSVRISSDKVTVMVFPADFRDNDVLILNGNVAREIPSLVASGFLTAFADGGGVSDPRATINIRYLTDVVKTKVWATRPDVNVAWSPGPANGNLFYGSQAITLTWKAGAAANSHNIYFGEKFYDVNEATTASVGIYRTNQSLANLSWSASTLSVGKTYYWRIDEVEAGGSVVHKGRVWQFTLSTKETAFGFNYWPAGYACDVLFDHNWAVAKEQVAADLDLMASYHTKILRQMVWPQQCGWAFYGGWEFGGCFTEDFDQITNNMVEFIKMANERGIKVVVSFGNNYYSLADETGLSWWRKGYRGRDPSDGGFDEFLVDTRMWINGFVDKIEASPWASTVIYYDYENEWYRGSENAASYIRNLYDYSHIPAGKRYGSVLQVYAGANDAVALKTALGTGRPLDAVDVHSYPDYPANENIEACYDLLAASYSSAAKYLGEFACQLDDETAQKNLVLNIAGRAVAKGYDGCLHWMLWGYDYSWGYDENSPKDIMGSMTQMFSPSLNPDMETLLGSVPANWVAGGTVAYTFTNSTGATNLKCARIQVNNTSGSVWMSSSAYPVTGGKKLFLNCYIQASMNNVYMGVTEYDAHMNQIAQTRGPGFSPASSSQWYGYVYQIPSWFVPLKKATRYIIISIGGDVTGNPSILDVDTVSVYESSAEYAPQSCQESLLQGWRLNGDVNGDCRVDFADFAKLAEEWTRCTAPTDAACEKPWTY